MLGLSRWHLFAGLVAIVCVVGIVWLALAYFIPAPPSKIVIAGSFKGGHYEALALRYKDILARSNMTVEPRATDGAVENLSLLMDPKSGVQIAFMQGGVSDAKRSPGLLSLGRIDYQVFWLFHRAADTFDDLTQLKGKRIALGPTGSGTRAVSEKILAIGGINYDNTTLLTLAAQSAVDALVDGKIDALFLTFAPDSPILQNLLINPSVQPMSFTGAEALTRIFPYLVRLSLPRGVIDYQRKIPGTDVTTIATTNVVLVRDDVHPVVIDLLAQTIMEAHGGPGLFQQAGDFPTLTDPEFPMAPSAREFYRNGPSFLGRYMPFWMTSYAQRFIALLVTVLAIVLPLHNYGPRLYGWFVRSFMTKLYRRLRIIETQLQQELSVHQVVGLQADLANLDRAAGVLPMRHSDLFLSVHGQIERTRAQLATRLVEMRNQTAKVA